MRLFLSCISVSAPLGIFDKQLRNLTHELIELGYTLDEITEGVNAYLLQLDPKSSDRYRRRSKELKPEKSFRVLDFDERKYIGSGAYGYMCLLRELGLISMHETEEIISFILDNELFVEEGEQLQRIMMDMLLENGNDDMFFYLEDQDDDSFYMPNELKAARKRRIN